MSPTTLKIPDQGRYISYGPGRSWSRELGFSSINLDLIVGLPKQTVANFSRTLARVTAWAPDRLAVFGYTHVPWLKKPNQVFSILNNRAQEDSTDVADRRYSSLPQ